MMKKNKIGHAFIMLLLCIATNGFSQFKEYNYKAKINNVSDTWHTLKLPNQAYSYIKKDYSDIRIYGLSASDTIEVPYVKEILSDKKASTKISISIINETKSDKGSFFTIKNEKSKEINAIELLFKEENFDWYVTLEGSNNNSDWFMISEKERIVSLKRNSVDFKATKINFPTINYKFIRVLVNNIHDLNLVDALISNHEIIKGEEVFYDKRKQTIAEKKESKKTSISIQLKEKSPVSKIVIPIDSDVDYYRRIHIKTLRDSIVLEKKTKYNYTNIGSYEISSYKKNEIHINRIIADNFIIEIENLDNQSLKVGDITMTGNPLVLKARFPKENLNYFLSVGNKYERSPNYDIASFVNNIPENLKQLSVNDLVVMSKKQVVKKGPVLPFPKYILWIVLLLIIAILGFFTYKMLNK